MGFRHPVLHVSNRCDKTDWYSDMSQVISCLSLQHTLQHTATHYSTRLIDIVQHTLHHTATHCNTLHHKTDWYSDMSQVISCLSLQHTLQNTATHCNTLQHTTSDIMCDMCTSPIDSRVCITNRYRIHPMDTRKVFVRRDKTCWYSDMSQVISCVSVQHTLQHTATHCNTLQHKTYWYSDMSWVISCVMCARHACTSFITRIDIESTRWIPRSFLYSIYTCTYTNTYPYRFTYTNMHSFQKSHANLHIYNALQHTATHCNALQRTATRERDIHMCIAFHKVTQIPYLQSTTRHCKTLQDTARHCNTLQHTATHCNTLQHTATHCSKRARHTNVQSFQ